MLEKSHVFYTKILSKKTEKSLKMTSKMLSKMWLRNGGGRFEALLGPFSRRNVFLTPKNVNKVLQKWLPGFKIAPKMTPRVHNNAKKPSKSQKKAPKDVQDDRQGSKKYWKIKHLKLPIIDSTNLETGPADCAKRFE